MEDKMNIEYNRSPIWRIGGFVLNNTATNTWMFFMNFIAYYATGIVGLGVMLISSLLTYMRIFDGITDPIIGWLIDRTNGKLGKFRPFMILGNLILLGSTYLLVHTTHLMPAGFKLVYFILIYLVYVIGYTFQTACTKAAQNCLTNEPKQRPTFSLFDGIYNTALFALMPMLISTKLIPKFGGFKLELFHEFWVISAVASLIMTAIAVISIWPKDCSKYFGIGKEQPKIKFKEYWDVLKNNRAIQMLIVAASSDKLALTVATNATVMIMLFGIVCGDYGTYGKLSGITAIPVMVILMIGVFYARRFGQKKALIFSTLLAIIFQTAIALLLVIGDPTKISFTSIGFMTIAFITLYTLMMAAKGVAGNIVIPMIADCADYETYRSGRYVPGMMGTLFSFVDKLISSFATTLVGACVALIGFKTQFPTVDTPYSTGIFAMMIFMFCGLPIIGWICTLIAMKFYPLTDTKMQEIQKKISDLKKAN